MNLVRLLIDMAALGRGGEREDIQASLPNARYTLARTDGTKLLVSDLSWRDKVLDQGE